jgi:hypothetical protein
MFYGFKRPLMEAVIWGSVLGAATFFLLGIPGIIFGVLYFILNKRLTIGFTDIGGRVSEVAFKRSVIEGKLIDESDASRVCDILQALVDARHEMALNVRGSESVPAPAPGPVPTPSQIRVEQTSVAVPTPHPCKKCGQPLDAASTFCDECGTQVG